MLIVEIPILIFVCYEACILFIDRRREKRRIIDEEKGLENLSSAVLDDFRQFILGGSGPSGNTWEAVKKNNREIVGTDYVGWFYRPRAKRHLRGRSE